MSPAIRALLALACLAALMIVLPLWKPELRRVRGSRILLVVAFLILPGLVTWGGTAVHLEHAKSTAFCLSCHEMAPYGASLRIDDGKERDTEAEHLPAVHFQNRWIDPERACFTCHTEYTMFGGVRAKLRGLRHVWVHYAGTPASPLALYEPYNNRECLHCHGGARRYEEAFPHAESKAELDSGTLACKECHEKAHDAAHLTELKMREEGR